MELHHKGLALLAGIGIAWWLFRKNSGLPSLVPSPNVPSAEAPADSLGVSVGGGVVTMHGAQEGQTSPGDCECWDALQGTYSACACTDEGAVSQSPGMTDASVMGSPHV